MPLAAVPLWCACASTADGQLVTRTTQITESSAPVAAFRTTAVGFGDTMRASETAGHLPPAGHVVVPPDMQPLIERMWRDSPTFRRQCARLVDGSVTIVVRFAGRSTELGFAHARSTIITQQGKVTSVDVTLGSSIDLAYLAHEIEHVLEQLDGVDLRSAAAHHVRGVDSKAGVFETARAISVEARVARELGMQSPSQNDASGRRMAGSCSRRRGR
jgi:hypothetical protein